MSSDMKPSKFEVGDSVQTIVNNIPHTEEGAFGVIIKNLSGGDTYDYVIKLPEGRVAVYHSEIQLIDINAFFEQILRL